ncbi:MAG TPA: glycosyltransferase family 4 protein [Candidatus Krumholzibacteria bacterium]|nr:glycosyltransferase family 4 protein [Candidatus Krumholzibacteria bacterium]HPD70784.1 glycosyltransferase family 4 protein [Candidatus Krumholzibacteria bacterium]HRY39516.1 glycosyltransferase family 4 protein [Candidatus Krumholzibacteria bacterium]
MRLLYLTTNFHSLTLTFVTREVDQLRRQGHHVSLLSLRRRSAHEADRPECDLTGCLYLFPIPPARLVTGTLRTLVMRPRRSCRALRLALTSPAERWPTRIKLIGQLAAATTIAPLVSALEVEHLHAHLASPPGNYALFLSILTGVPFSFTGHAADLFRKPEAMRLKLRHAAGAVAISEFNHRHYLRWHPELARAAVIHCGIRLADFPFQARQRTGGPLRILAVGRAAEKKGFTHLLDALAILSSQRIDWTGHLVGGGPLLDDLRRQAASLSLRNLEIAGPLQQAEIRSLLAAADVFVLPCVAARDGDVDGIPVALMEAMASGCPVVSTRISGIPELVVDGRTGLLAEPGDASGLAAAIRRLADEPELAARLADAGRTHVAQSFNLETETSRLADFFRDLIAAPRPGRGQ